MKRIIFMSAALLVLPGLAAAQSTPSTVPLAEVAKKEEQRQKETKKPSKVFTNKDLKPDTGKPNTAATAKPASADTAAPVEPEPAAKEDAAPAKDQAYWQNRMKVARDEVTRLQMFADALQSRINALTTDYVNRDDPAARDKVDVDRRAAIAELGRVQKDLEAKKKEITAIEDEARRAGVPPGWLRPA